MVFLLYESVDTWGSLPRRCGGLATGLARTDSGRLLGLPAGHRLVEAARKIPRL